MAGVIITRSPSQAKEAKSITFPYACKNASRWTILDHLCKFQYRKNKHAKYNSFNVFLNVAQGKTTFEHIRPVRI